MLSSMTLAEIQAKYSGIHTPEEIDQFHQNMTNSKKWKIVKNERLGSFVLYLSGEECAPVVC